MRKVPQIFYIVLCMAICLVPFAGMTFWATDSTTENKTLASFPSLVGEDGVNLDFFDELADYFEDHFAFREALVNADAVIMGQVFGESNEDTVIQGENGWLYYTDTLDDYLGQNLMSDRSISNAAHNLALVQEYVEAGGAQFVLTVAPNKNSLYGENMPYYDSVIVSDESNAERLKEQLEENGINYVDLFALFESQDEVLYLKRDSHWNNKGALLAYNALMDALNLEHEDYETTEVLRTQTEVGDLATMLYPLTAEPEWNYYYQYESAYSYVTETQSVEDAWIVTENDNQENSLLMFRDSFGNTLLPFMAEAFGEGYFAKGEPYAIGRYMSNYEPNVVIIERVERNLSDFAENPPVMQCLQADEETAELVREAATNGNAAAENNVTTCEIKESESDTSYYVVSGIADESCCSAETVFNICLSSGGSDMIFQAYCVTTQNSDYGYLLYLSKDSVEEMGGRGSITVEVVAETEGDYTLLYSGDM